jgi:dihydrolipoyl dehydrogenase
LSKTNHYDVIIIGAGPGGYVSAIRAGQLGLSVCVIEKDSPGGVCLNRGCIPSKNLIHQAKVFLAGSELEAIGVSVDYAGLDYSAVQEKSRKATKTLVDGITFLLKKNKVALIKATATITDRNTVTLDNGTVMSGKNIIIATGSRPAEMPGFEFDEKKVLSSNGILAMKTLPKSLVILGAGAIGCEFAYIMNAFGVEVTLVEMAEHILPFEDAETVAVLESGFGQKGINVLVNTRALSLDKKKSGVSIDLAVGDKERVNIKSEAALCVFGRRPNTEDIGLENIGLDTDRGYIPVGDYGQTSVPGIYAIGDVVDTPLLAHVASREGEITVEHIAGLDPEPRIDANSIPSAIYCEPQLASFGIREAQAEEKKIPYKKSVFPYRGAGKAVAVGKAEGVVKVLYDPATSEILGAHIVGCDATELIHEVLLAKTNELLPENIARMVHAHPTISEAIMESMRGVEGKPVHI